MNIDTIAQKYCLTELERKILNDCWLKKQSATHYLVKAIWNKHTKQIEISRLPVPIPRSTKDPVCSLQPNSRKK